MAKRHEGKTVVISGAASGIGQASAVRLAEEGARIVIADRDKAERHLQLIERRRRARPPQFECDVSNPASVAALKAEVEKGGGRCDILVNNAGIYPMQTFDDITLRRLAARAFGQSRFDVPDDQSVGRRHAAATLGPDRQLASDTVSLLVPNFIHYITSKAGVDRLHPLARH